MYPNFTKSLFSLLFLGFSFVVNAQTGVLKGSISDAKTKEPLIGATVRLEGLTIGASSNVDGSFEIAKIPAGNYKLIISSVGYQPNQVSNVRVEANKETVISATLIEESTTLNAVVVKAQKMTTTEVAVLTETRQIQQVAVGISGQQIQKTQDRDASSVVRRIPGVSIFDERFVVVRGLNERYNTVLVNDIITPSTEVDSKAFSFDLIPSSIIDRMLVLKSASADLPGDLGGGAIKIYTKSVPDGNNLSVNFTTSYRSNTTGKNQLSYAGSSTDWLGFDNGLRQLPAVFPSRNSIANAGSSEAVISRFRSLPAFYQVQNTNILPDFRGNINFSHRWFLGEKELTNFSYVNYSNTNQSLNIQQKRFTYQGDTEKYYNDESLAQNVRIGMMSNWALILNPANKIEFRNLFNQIGIKETVFRTGYNENVELSNGSFRYEQRSIYSGQVSGTHEISDLSKIKWVSGFGYTYRLEPDYRRYTRSRERGTNGAYSFDLQQSDSPTLQQSARSYSVVQEFIYTGRFDYEKILKQNENEKLRSIFRTGFYTEYKDRSFTNRWYGITNPNRLSTYGEGSLLTKNPEEFFKPSNLSGSSVYYGVGTNFEDRYVSQNNFAAAYAQLYVSMGPKLQHTIGFRGEYNNQELQSRERGSGRPINVKNEQFSPLPSINSVYHFNEKSLLRFAYSSTVNRPEFRELAPFTYYDFVYDVTRTGFIPRPGKERLLNATIHNLDLRYDFYPSKNEIISVGAFYKKFFNPIEAKVFYNGSTVAFTVDNAEQASSTGVEIEIRKKIANKWMALLNAAVINSNVLANQSDNLLNRNLQGQSPYLINAGIFFEDDEKGWQANILYNIIGKRIFVIGDNQISADIYEMPRNVVDINITKRLAKNIDLKIAAQDILNNQFRLVQDTNRDGKISSADGTYQSYYRGGYFSAGITYKLN